MPVAELQITLERVREPQHVKESGQVTLCFRPIGAQRHYFTLELLRFHQRTFLCYMSVLYSILPDGKGGFKGESNRFRRRPTI